MNRILIAIFLLLLAGCQLGNEATPSLGTLEVHRVSIVADSAEPIIEVPVVEGDSVEPGGVLMRQDPRRIGASLQRAEADVAAAKAELEKAEHGPRSEDIAAARAQVAAADSDAKTAGLELSREASLVKQHYSSQNNVDIKRGQYDAAVARKQEAESHLAELLAGTRPEDIAAARGNYAMARAQVDDIKISLARTTITAPIRGKVEAVINQVGERPKPGATVIVLVKDERPYARVQVPEPLRTRLQTGAPAEIHIDGHDRTYRGRLRWIAHDASFTPYFALTQHDRSHLSYLAEVELTGNDIAGLPTGVPVQVFFPGVE